MAEFTVTCETCQTRLRVHDDSTAGQIHPCPKCGGMVAIVPPAMAADVEASESAVVMEAVRHPLVDFLLRNPALALAGSGAVFLVAIGLVSFSLLMGADEPPVVAEMVVEPPVLQPPVETPPAVEVEEPLAPKTVAVAADDDASEEPPAKPLVVAAEVAPAIAEEPVQEPVKSKSFNPLDFDPAELDLAVERSEVDGTDENPTADDDPKTAVDVDVPPEPKPNVVLELGPTDTGQPAVRSAATQLALKLENVELPAVPLVEVLEMISDLAAMPITIDPATLRMAGITARTPVSFSAQNITLAELLTGVLAKHRLARSDLDDQIVIRHVLEEQSQAVDYKVADLIPAHSDASDLAALIERMVDPASWQSGGGPGRINAEGATLKLHNGRRTLFDVLVFCERLRLARGLPKQSRISKEILLTESPYEALQPTLARKTTFTFPAWTPLKQVFRYLGKETGTTVLVDWPALAEQNLDPRTQVMCSAIDARWDAALDAALGTLELTWIAVDPKTIWITSRSAAAELSSVQFYPIDAVVPAEFSSPELLISSLHDTFPDVQLEYDAPSKHLIALAPEQIHRQLFRRLTSLQPPTANPQPLSQSAVPTR